MVHRLGELGITISLSEAEALTPVGKIVVEQWLKWAENKRAQQMKAK